MLLYRWRPNWIFPLSGLLFTVIVTTLFAWFGSPVEALAIVFAVVIILCAVLAPQQTALCTWVSLLIYLVIESAASHWIPGQLEVILRSMNDVGGCLIFLCGLVFYVRNRVTDSLQAQRMVLFCVPAILFVFVGALSGFLHHNPTTVTLYGITIYLRYLMMFVGLMLLRPTRVQFELFVRLIRVIASIESLLAILQAIFGTAFSQLFTPRGVQTGMFQQLTGRFTQVTAGHLYVFGTFDRYNTLGFFLCFSLLIQWYAYKTETKRKSIVYTCLILTAMVLTASRLCWILVILAFFARLQGYRKVKPFLMIFGLGLLTLYTYFLTYLSTLPIVLGAKATLWDRVAEILNPALYMNMSYSTPVGSQYRIWLLFVGSQHILHSALLFGFGAGAFLPSFALAKSVAASIGFLSVNTSALSDNGWVAILGEYGIVGIGLFLLVLRAAFVIVKRTRHGDMDRELLTLTKMQFMIMMVAGLAEPIFEGRLEAFIFWLFIGLVSYRSYTDCQEMGKTRFQFVQQI